jgi:hypothetical protein
VTQLQLPAETEGGCLDAHYSAAANRISLLAVDCAEAAPILCYQMVNRPPPPTPDCPAGEVARFTRFPSMLLVGQDDRLLQGVSFEECLKACQVGNCQVFGGPVSV